MEERYKTGITVDLMLTRENNGSKEILLSLRKNTGYNDGKFELPGGHVEENEDIMEAMIREAKEELKIDLKVEDLKIEHILHHYKGDRIKFILSAKKYTGNIEIGEPDKCEKIEWYEINKLPTNIDEKLKKILIEINQGIFYDNSNFVNLKQN